MKFLKALIIVILFSAYAQAATFELNNGDKISGEVIEETDTSVTVITSALGEVTIDKIYIKPEEPPKMESKNDSPWSRKFSVAASTSEGNDPGQDVALDLNVTRKGDNNDQQIRGTFNYSRDDGAEDENKFYGLLRHSENYGDSNQWFRFVKSEFHKDKNANINSRKTPSAGVGYWFKNEDDFKLSAEVALGYEITNYEDAETTTETTLIPRGYIEKVFANGAKLTSDLVVYPSLEESGELRLRSETVFTKALSDRINFKLSFLDEYDTDPTGDKESNDYTLTSGLEIDF